MKNVRRLLRIKLLFLMCLFSFALYGNNSPHILSDHTIIRADVVADPVFEVSDQNSGPWLNTISVELGNRLTLWYRITLDGSTESVRIVFPIYDNVAETSIGEAHAIMKNSEWNTISLTGINPNDYTKSDALPGVVDISSLNGKTEVLFQLSSSGTLSSTGDIMSKNAVCDIQGKVGRKWNSFGEITISKKLKNPSIVNFSAERSVLISGEQPELFWSVVDADSIEILERSSNRVVHASSDLQGEWTAKAPNANIEYLLRAKFQTNSSPEVEVPIKLFDASVVATIKNQFDDQQLMGLYNHPVETNEKMIALVKHNDLLAANVFVWESKDGLLWEKSTAYSKIPAFIDNDRNTVNVPLEFAGSPGVVYRNSLYLIGGSRFNPNMRSNEVYFYDFGDEGKGWQKGGNAPFSPRMGHNCVVYNGEIWALGGSDARGALDECWIYDGTSWKKSNNNKLPSRKCMASAMVVKNSQGRDEIQVFGGFGDLPGFPDQTVSNSFFFNGSRWNSFTWNGTNNLKYSACAISPLKNNRFIFTTNYNNGDYQSKLQKINATTFTDLRGMELTIGDSYYTIETVTFKDVVWLCITTEDGGVKTTDLRYLVYVN